MAKKMHVILDVSVLRYIWYDVGGAFKSRNV